MLPSWLSLNSFFKQLRRLFKYIIHIWTGKSEIERLMLTVDLLKPLNKTETTSLLTNKNVNKDLLVDSFISLVSASTQLSAIKKIIFSTNTFRIRVVLDTIIQLKYINTNKATSSIQKNLIRANITHCLNELNAVNLVRQYITNLKRTTFSNSNLEHIQLLNDLWNHLKPSSPRPSCKVDDSIQSSDWSDIGFQGLDPSTDLRGMGILGLYQLVYLSKCHPNISCNILRESNHPTRYYPFAATGINITAFVTDMLDSTRFYSRILKKLRKYDLQDMHSFKAKEIESDGLVFINELYCEVFVTFNNMWVDKNPSNIFAFPSIFEEVKLVILKKYPLNE